MLSETDENLKEDEENKDGEDSESMPELSTEEVGKKGKKPGDATEPKNHLKRKTVSPPLSPYYRSSYNSTAPPNWQYQSMPPLPAPPLKRHRSNHFFERCAFFANNGAGDLGRSLGLFPASPCLSRQESLCASVGPDMSFPGITLDERELAELTNTDLLAPPDLKSATSAEFLSDFY